MKEKCSGEDVGGVCMCYGADERYVAEKDSGGIIKERGLRRDD